MKVIRRIVLRLFVVFSVTPTLGSGRSTQMNVKSQGRNCALALTPRVTTLQVELEFAGWGKKNKKKRTTSIEDNVWVFNVWRL